MDNNAAPLADLQVPPLFPAFPPQDARRGSNDERHQDGSEPPDTMGFPGAGSQTSISDISEAGAPVTPPAARPILAPFLLIHEEGDHRAPSFNIAPPPPTEEQRANSIGMVFIRLLLLHPTPQTFGPGHRLIVNRVLVATSDRPSIIPAPVNILRMECSGADTHTNQWPPGITCIACVRICTYEATHFISGAWKFTMNANNPFLLECTEEVLGLQLHLRD